MANIERRAKEKAVAEERVRAVHESKKQKLLLDQLQKVEELEEGKMKMRSKVKKSVEIKAKQENEGRVAVAKKASNQMLHMIHRESQQKADQGKEKAEKHMEKTAKTDADRAAQITAAISARDSPSDAGKVARLKHSEIGLAKEEKNLENRMAKKMSAMASVKEHMAQLKVHMLGLQEGSPGYEVADAQMQRLSLRHSTLAQEMFRMEHKMTNEEDKMSSLEAKLDAIKGRHPNPKGDMIHDGWLHPRHRDGANKAGWLAPDREAAAQDEREDREAAEDKSDPDRYPNAPQYHMPAVTNGGACHITLAGRPSSLEALARFPVKCTPNHALAAVRCCSDTGPSMTPRGCYTANYESAKARCDEIDARLCGKDELDSARGTGCDFDNARVWTSTHGKLDKSTGTDGANEIVPRLDQTSQRVDDVDAQGSDSDKHANKSPIKPSKIARAVQGVGDLFQKPAFLIVMIVTLVTCVCCCGLLLLRSYMSYSAKVGFEDRNDEGDYGDRYKYSPVKIHTDSDQGRRLSGDFYAETRRGLI